MAVDWPKFYDLPGNERVTIVVDVWRVHQTIFSDQIACCINREIGSGDGDIWFHFYDELPEPELVAGSWKNGISIDHPHYSLPAGQREFPLGAPGFSRWFGYFIPPFGTPPPRYLVIAHTATGAAVDEKPISAPILWETLGFRTTLSCGPTP